MKDGFSINIQQLFLEYDAEIAHNIWSHWMRDFLGKFPTYEIDEDFTIVIPKEDMYRWRQLMNTSYEDLTEEEKESDREVAKLYFKHSFAFDMPSQYPHQKLIKNEQSGTMSETKALRLPGKNGDNRAGKQNQDFLFDIINSNPGITNKRLKTIFPRFNWTSIDRNISKLLKSKRVTKRADVKDLDIIHYYRNEEI